jgi:hypothetical protein
MGWSEGWAVVGMEVHLQVGQERRSRLYERPFGNSYMRASRLSIRRIIVR